MSARTGELSLDGAWGIDVNVPANPSVAMCNVYNGAAIPSKAWADGLGRPVLMGFESAVDRAFGGAQAAAVDSPFSANVYDAWPYPRECGSWFCAHDGPSTPGWALTNITDYADVYCTGQMLRGRLGPLTPYGNPAAIAAAVAGIERAGGTFARWGVGTWGYGEGGGPNQPPPFADCEQLQSGNTSGPYPATDLNWLYADLSVFAPYGLALPPAPTVQEDDMPYVGIIAREGGPTNDFDAFLVDGGVWTRQFQGDQTALGYITIPKAAADWLADRPDQVKKMIEYNGIEWGVIDARTKGKLGAPAAPGGGVAPLDVDGLVSALAGVWQPNPGPSAEQLRNIIAAFIG